MFHIHVLRVKCESLPQGDLLRGTDDRIAVIVRSFEAKPTADVGRGSEWHIGNIEHVGDDGIAFAMGRTQAVKSPQFDLTTHDFMEEEAMRAPFTIGVFDRRTQTCGIIRKSGVSQSSSEIAGKLARLLNSQDFAREANAQIIVEPIPDPMDFIEAIRRAQAVTRFSFTVSRPNPADVQRLIQAPAKAFTQEAGGEKGKVEVEGRDLDRDVLADVTQAVAADGERAWASLRESEGSPPRRMFLSGNPVAEKVEPKPDESLFASVLNAARRAYVRVRGTSAS